MTFAYVIAAVTVKAGTERQGNIMATMTLWVMTARMPITADYVNAINPRSLRGTTGRLESER